MTPSPLTGEGWGEGVLIGRDLKSRIGRERPDNTGSETAMKTVYLLACVKTKKARPMPAKDLYASNWFKKARAYAEQNGSRWYILSAEHGLVHPETVIAPYNKTLVNMPKSERRVWSDRVFHDIEDVVGPSDCVVFLAGVKYREFLFDMVRALCAEVQVPMEGLSNGKQLRWLKERTGG